MPLLYIASTLFCDIHQGKEEEVWKHAFTENIWYIIISSSCVVSANSQKKNTLNSYTRKIIHFAANLEREICHKHELQTWNINVEWGPVPSSSYVRIVINVKLFSIIIESELAHLYFFDDVLHTWTKSKYS